MVKAQHIAYDATITIIIDMEFTEKTIIDILHGKYEGNSKFRIPNVFLFRWESDFFLMKETGYCCEFEIKISKSDFRRDALKNEKFSIMQNGYFIAGHRLFKEKLPNKTNLFYEPGDKVPVKRPNKFYYVVPENMITVSDVPAYAGLIYVTKAGRTITIKEASFLHREKLDVYPELCTKFYWYWLNQCSKTRMLEEEIERMKQQPLLFY